MTSEERKQIKWSPYDKEHEGTLAFVSNRHGFSLYQQQQTSQKEQVNKKGGEEWKLKNSFSSSSFRFSCLDFSPIDKKRMIALGSDIGQVTMFVDEDGQKMIGPPLYSSSSSRSLRFLSWEPYIGQSIVLGYDSYRNEPGVCTIDVSTGQILSTFGINEGAQDGTFIREQTIAIGMQSRFLRIYDLRTTTEFLNQVVAFPFGPVQGNRCYKENFIASFGSIYSSENETQFGVKIWDIRKMDQKPVQSLSNVGKTIEQIEWSPERDYVLHLITGQDTFIRSFGLKDMENDAIVLPNRGLPNIVNSMAFHPSSSLIAVSQGGQLIDVTNFRPQSLHQQLPTTDSITSFFSSTNTFSEDASTKFPLLPTTRSICLLAKAGYGADPVLNSKLTKDSIKRIWEWISRNGHKTFVDACSSLSRRTFFLIPSYTSSSRAIAIKSCGWGGGGGNRLKLAQEEGDWQTVVALCLLDVRDVKKAVSYLKSGPWIKDNLCVAVASAIAGWPGASFTTTNEGGGGGETTTSNQQQPSQLLLPLSTANVLSSPDQNTINRPPSRLTLDDDEIARAQLWCDSVIELEQRLKPLLRAAFILFLYCTNPKQKDENSILKILNEDMGLTLTDRFAIACAYASDDILKQFIEKEISLAMETGKLEALLLTGLDTVLSRNLMQTHINLIGDSQTIALIIGQMSHSSSYGTIWLNRYRDLLDEIGLYHSRAKLDVALSTTSSTFVGEGSSSINVHCARCGTNRSKQHMETSSPSVVVERRSWRLCEKCSRTLPVCAVCLFPMEASNPLMDRKSNNNNNNNVTTTKTEFKTWLTWCLECKHGGHVGCFNDWLSHQHVCPVSTCSCTKCGKEQNFY